MAAFLEPSEGIGQVSKVRHLAWKHLKECDRAGPSFRNLCDDIRTLYCDLQLLEEDLANPKSFLKRCDHHTEVELRELTEECVEDLQEVEVFLSDLSPQRRNSTKSLDRELQALRKKICDRTSNIREFKAQATAAALENMKAQLFTLVEDIVSARRQPYILTKIVDWDALAHELREPAFADRAALELNEDEGSSDDGVIELPDSPTEKTHPSSPERSSTEESKHSRKTHYRQPTVEDWVEGDDEELLSPTTLPPSARSPDTSADSVRRVSPPGSLENSEGKLPNVTGEALQTGPYRKPQRVDTEMKLMQEEKLTLKEELRKLKEEIERQEEQNSLANFRAFCAGFTKADEASILAERWRIPPQSFDKVNYFVMPSGEVYISRALKRDSKTHPTPPLPNAIRRGSSYAIHTSGSGNGGGSSGGSAGIASPFRRDSAIFGGLSNQPHREDSFNMFSEPIPRTPDGGSNGLGIEDERSGRWPRIAESPREMSPVSNERTPTLSQPPPSVPLQHSPPLTPRPAEVIQHPLPLTLEEIFNGVEKIVRIDRRVFDPYTGFSRREPKELKVPIKKGLMAGSKIKFSGVGNQGPDGVGQDVWFIVKDKPHHYFNRVGSDLHTTIDLTFAEAKLGWEKKIYTICGRKIRVKGPKNTPVNWTRKYRDFGMPRSGDPSQRGNLIVNVEIQPLEHPGVV